MVLCAGVVLAAKEGDVEALRRYLDSGTDVQDRTAFQTGLVHIAAKHGHADVLRELLARGASPNALDYGGMRRTPLHWACQMNRVYCVELLVEAGADVTAQGRTWSKLIQGQACGKLIDCHSPHPRSPESLCQQNSVRLALRRPEWNRNIHSQFPQKFKDVAKLLITLATLPEERYGADCAFGKLGMDECLEVLKRLAYPISDWL